MSGANNAIVLDAWAMLAYLQAEPAAQEVRQALRRARRRKFLILFSIISFGECLYVIERQQGTQRALDDGNIIDQLPLRVVPADRALVFEAAHLKARYPISYADAFAAALAKQHRARLMTGDPEFKAVEPEVAIHWLPGRRRERTKRQ